MSGALAIGVAAGWRIGMVGFDALGAGEILAGLAVGAWLLVWKHRARGL
jgi:hypothetical protein